AAVVQALGSVRTEREAALTETIVDVALGLCEWLAPAAAAIDRRGLAQLVGQALAAGGGKDLTLRLNGDDAAELGNQIPAGVTCEVVADLAPGEVWVEAPRLVVDARWPTRLAALREPLLALLKAAAPGYELATDDDRPQMSQRISIPREERPSMSQRISIPREERMSQRIPVQRGDGGAGGGGGNGGGRGRGPARGGA
ncbi:MAG TPA: FliH/SctL family protein, partial [Kofleriaceae bacterium]|nr:FliH/SctL family protein [Kofleriaceae bacterium]